jgi:hypothetical protein
VAYLIFFGTFLNSIGFVEGLMVPKTIDGGAVAPAAPLPQALLVNLMLMSIFATQHSATARPQFKRWWMKFVPHSVECNTYVLLASFALAPMIWQWETIYDELRIQLARTSLNSCVQAIEFYKVQHGSYPESLEEPRASLGKESLVLVYDPTMTKFGLPRAYFFYQRVRTDHYYLRGVGPDPSPPMIFYRR